MGEAPKTSQRVCRCEATIAPSILEGYACGRPDCWRTPAVRDSFDRFVADLIRRREDAGAHRSDEPASG